MMYKDRNVFLTGLKTEKPKIKGCQLPIAGSCTPLSHVRRQHGMRDGGDVERGIKLILFLIYLACV